MRTNTIDRRVAVADRLSEQEAQAEAHLAWVVDELQALALEQQALAFEDATGYGSRELDARLRDIEDDLDDWCAVAEDAATELRVARAATDEANQHFSPRELF